MAYTTPTLHQFQAEPHKVDLDKFEANVTEFIAICHIPMITAMDALGIRHWHAIEHRHRWMFYISESEDRPGEMGPWDQTIDDITTLEYTTTGLWIDMDTFAWTTYGRIYTMEHTTVSFEVSFEIE